MPFGLVNASAVFQRVMDQVLRGMEANTGCFIDDILIATDTEEEHLEVVAEVLRRLEAAGLKCHPKKCRWMQPSVEYLGHNIGQGGISPVEAKVSCIDAMPAPTNVSELRSFLGMANYYRRHILDFSKTARPLNQLLKKEAGWEWGAAQRDGWEGLKAALKSAPVLQAPVKGLPYQLATDWSSSGMGAVLSQQRPDGSPGVIAYASTSCNPAEQNYSSYEGEMLAAVWAVRHFRAYLHGNKFELFTDHQPLSWLMGTGDLKGKLARWALLLMEHDFTITYRAGTLQGHVDALSRIRSVDGTVAAVAEANEGWRAFPEAGWLALGVPTTSPVDPWADPVRLQRIRADPAASDGERYYWLGGAMRFTRHGEVVEVPPPEDRERLVTQSHAQLGHYGAGRTLSLLQNSFWWPGMARQVKAHVARCLPCDRTRSRLAEVKQELQSLPLVEMGMRWSLDFAGNLPVTARGNRYVLVLVDHASKWAEAEATPDKSAETVKGSSCSRSWRGLGAAGRS